MNLQAVDYGSNVPETEIEGAATNDHPDVGFQNVNPDSSTLGSISLVSGALKFGYETWSTPTIKRIIGTWPFAWPCPCIVNCMLSSYTISATPNALIEVYSRWTGLHGYRVSCARTW